MLLTYLADIQYWFLGIILLYSGVLKVFGKQSGVASTHSALKVILKNANLALILYKIVGFVELSVGVLLLVPIHYGWIIYLTTGLTICFVAYVLIALKKAPGMPCSCLGKHEQAISWRSLVRAVFFLALSVFGWKAKHLAIVGLLKAPYQSSLVLIFETLLFLYLSPEVHPVFKNIRGSIFGIKNS